MKLALQVASFLNCNKVELTMQGYVLELDRGMDTWYVIWIRPCTTNNGVTWIGKR